MEPFAKIWARAAKRKGGDAELEALLPEIKSPEELRAIPDDRWLAELTKRIFQAGFVWKVIESKWEGFEAAFHGFGLAKLTSQPEGAWSALLADTRIVRNRQKIAAVRHNAGFLAELARRHGGVGAFFADWLGENFVGLLEVLKTRGSRLGGFTAQVFLRAMGRDSFILSPDVSAALVAAGVVGRPPSTKAEMAAVQAAFNEWARQSGRPMGHIGRTLACSVGD